MARVTACTPELRESLQRDPGMPFAFCRAVCIVPWPPQPR